MSEPSENASGRATVLVVILPFALLAALGSLWGMTPPVGKLIARAGIPLVNLSRPR